MLSSTKSFSTCAQPAFVSRCIPLISPAPSSSLRQTRLVTCPMSSADSKLTFDAAQSASYDEVVVKPLAGPFFDVLRRLSSPAVGDACLDVATGTGPVAFRVASLIGSTVRTAVVLDSQSFFLLLKCVWYGAGVLFVVSDTLAGFYARLRLRLFLCRFLG